MGSYSSFAALIGKFPELHNYRRFDGLGAKMVLYQQAELIHLEAELGLVAGEDAKREDSADFDKSWWAIREASKEPGACYQHDLIAKTQGKLKEYHKTLLRIAQLHTIPPPSKNALDFQRRWLQCPKRGHEFFQGPEGDPWESEFEKDLVSLCVEAPTDRLAQKLSRLGSLWHRLVGHRQSPTHDLEAGLGPVWQYKHSGFVCLGDVFCVLSSTLIPTISTIVLFFVNDTLYRLAIIALFTLLLAIVMMFVLNCKRVEVFAATASFAAVQVVFLQGVNAAVQGAS